jgi:hypothetical protein
MKTIAVKFSFDTYRWLIGFSFGYMEWNFKRCKFLSINFGPMAVLFERPPAEQIYK